MRVRSTEGLEVLRCPFCGLRIVGDPAALTFSHLFTALFPSFRPVSVEPTVYVKPPPKGSGS